MNVAHSAVAMATTSDDLDALGRIRLFEGIGTEGLRLIAAVAREQSYRAGQIVFREGDIGGPLYLIREGRVRISRTVAGMGEEALAILGPGDAFGEMSLIEDVPRSADAIAHEACKLLVIERDPFEDLLLLHKDLAYEILWNFVRILSARLRETNEKMTFLSVTGKF
ncbi:MAG: cyclic nucleotide-binding domain-containing protein [Myxococcales bacterium]|nr:cyclic nucleotide-binding domain-containing protein [Myxococcales bacterium]